MGEKLLNEIYYQQTEINKLEEKLNGLQIQETQIEIPPKSN